MIPPRGATTSLIRAPSFMRLWAIGSCVNTMRWFELLSAALFTLDMTHSGLAVAAVHRRLLDARQSGVGILLISEDLDEVVALADRVQAVFKGRMSKAAETDKIDAKVIGLMMAGIWED